MQNTVWDHLTERREIFFVSLYLYVNAHKCLCFDLGILERQSAERGSSEKVQGKENGYISVAEEEDQKGSAQPESANGAAASENRGSAKITRPPATCCLKA